MSLEALSSQGCDHLSCKAYLADKLQRDAHHGASATRNNFHTRVEAFTEVDKLERLSSCANNLRLDAAKDEFGTPVADLEAAARRCPVSIATQGFSLLKLRCTLRLFMLLCSIEHMQQVSIMMGLALWRMTGIPLAE